MANRQPRSTRRPDVAINVPGVTPDMKVGDLTVSQHVDLLVQVFTQVPIQRGVPDPKLVIDAIGQIRQIIASPDDTFRQTQAAILAQLPKIKAEGRQAPRDGGPAPP